MEHPAITPTITNMKTAKEIIEDATAYVATAMEALVLKKSFDEQEEFDQVVIQLQVSYTFPLLTDAERGIILGLHWAARSVTMGIATQKQAGQQVEERHVSKAETAFMDIKSRYEREIAAKLTEVQKQIVQECFMTFETSE